ncbi:hypothetical protein Thermus77420_23910 [Thermus thalpophilus]|uniref:hypothetical protein n=1 Tax=Thermus sp. (strain 2.9) TaxID=1577051 RepID=UPI00068B08D3|nr:hypothetical protein [Thermus sp. 2.9]
MSETEWMEALFWLRSRGFVRRDGEREERRAFGVLERHRDEVRVHLEREGLRLRGLPLEEPAVFFLVPTPAYEGFLGSDGRARLRRQAETRLKAYLFLKHVLLGAFWGEVGPGFAFHPRADSVRHALLLSEDRFRYETFLRAEGYLEGEGDDDLLKAWDGFLGKLAQAGLLKKAEGERYVLSSLALVYEELAAQAKGGGEEVQTVEQ